MKDYKTVLKGYRMFDTWYNEENIPHDLVENWGHKEPLKTVYIAIHESDVKEVTESGVMSLYGYEIHYNEKSAIEECNDYNTWIDNGYKN